MTKLNNITLALLFGAASVAFAQSANGEEQSIAIDTMVITADALKVETPASESPRVLSIISEQELRTRAPQKLDEALPYTSGVTSQPYGADNDTDWFKVRGFDVAIYLDGSRLFRDGDLNVALFDITQKNALVTN